MKKPLIWGHRGAPRRAPANTLGSFLMAEQAGADGIELDIRLTSDGEPVVYHDPAITTDKNHLLEIGKLPQCETARLGIPSLDTVLGALSGETLVNIEIKAEPDISKKLVKTTVAAVSRILDSHPDKKVHVISSFHPEVINRIKEIIPRIPAGWLIKYGMEHKGSPKKFDFIHPHYLLATPRFIRSHHDLGHKIHVWTVNCPVSAVLLSLWKIDGLITDYPGFYSRFLGKRPA